MDTYILFVKEWYTLKYIHNCDEYNNDERKEY